MHTLALSVDGAKNLALIVIAAILVVAIVAALVVRWIVGKVIVAILALVIGGIVFAQRTKITDDVKDCDATFFGVHLAIPDSVKARTNCAAK